MERESKERRRSATEILIEEWGTSGRIRPKLHNLRDLLVQVELFRAADYVAVDLLNEKPPPRPTNGPAAIIDITLPTDSEIETMLNQMSDPGSSVFANIANSLANNNKDFYEKREQIKSMPISGNAPTAIDRGAQSQRIISDFMKFTASNLASNSKNVPTVENNSESDASTVTNSSSGSIVNDESDKIINQQLNTQNSGIQINDLLRGSALAAYSVSEPSILPDFGTLQISSQNDSDSRLDSNSILSNSSLDSMSQDISQNDLPQLSIFGQLQNEFGSRAVNETLSSNGHSIRDSNFSANMIPNLSLFQDSRLGPQSQSQSIQTSNIMINQRNEQESKYSTGFLPNLSAFQIPRESSTNSNAVESVSESNLATIDIPNLSIFMNTQSQSGIIPNLSDQKNSNSSMQHSSAIDNTENSEFLPMISILRQS